jgi:hypothetical protein
MGHDRERNPKNKDKIMYETDCPFCGAEIGWPELPRLRQTVYCIACKGRSRVSSVSPLELDFAIWEQDTRKGRGAKKIRIRTGKNGHEDFEEEEESDLDEPTHRFRGKRSTRLKRRSKNRNDR